MRKFQAVLFLLLGVAIISAFAVSASQADTVAVRFFSNGELIAVNRAVSGGLSPAESAVRALVTGPFIEEVALGITTRIPAGTRIEKLSIAGSSATIDFSQDILTGLDELGLKDIFDQFRSTLGDYPNISSIKLTCKGKLLSSYLPAAPDIGEPAPLLVKGNAVGLSGKYICVGPSHGRFWNGSGWYWQRSDPCGFGEAVLEDTNSIKLVQYLKQYVAQDGGIFASARELDESKCCHPSTGLAWWKMCSQSYLRNAGVPCSVWASYTGNCGADNAVGRSSDDIRCRPLYADWLGYHIYIAMHTNAGGGTGTETFRDSQMERPAHVANSLNLANAVNNGIVSTIRNTFPGESGWVNRGVKDGLGNYGEIRIPNRPAILVELGFHDHCTRDAVYLTNDFFRSVAMWGVYSGICSYFGNTPTWAKYSCEYVSDTIPTTMTSGQTYNAAITYRNRGVVWMSTYNFKVGAVSASDPLMTTRLYPVAGTIKPGSTATFSITLKAPATAGTYTTQWQMIREGYEWFGPKITKSVTVKAATGNITGTVRDAADNSVISGAQVAVTGGSSATTNASGVYTISGVNPGTYTLTTSKTGFVTQTGSVTVTAGATATKDFALLSSAPPTGAVVINSGAEYANNPVATLTISASGATQMQFKNESGSWSEWEPYATSKSWTLSTGDGTKTVSVQFKSAANILSTGTISDTIVLDTTPPTGAVVINSDDTYTNTTAVTLTLSSTEAAQMQFRNEGGSWSEWESYAADKSWTLSAGDETKTVSVQFKDAAGNISADAISDTIILDTTPPTGALVINSNDEYANDTSVTLTLSSPDAVQMQFRNESGLWSGWESCATSRSWTLSAGDGTKTVSVQFKDAAGNVSTDTISDTIILDTDPPTGSIIINSNDEYSNIAVVTLVLSSPDAVQMQFRNESGLWSDWESYATSKSWTLSADDGTKTVSVQFKDAAGNISVDTISDTIILDTTPPTGALVIDSGAEYANDPAVILTVSSSDAVRMQFRNESGFWSEWESYETSKSWTLSAGDGTKTVSVQFKDAAGNISADSISDSIILDTTPPSGSIVINSDDEYTNTTAAILTLTSPDAVQMQIRNESGLWSEWETYTASRLWTLSTPDGTKTVSVQFKDAAGNVSIGVISDTIILDTAPPTGSIVINDGDDFTNDPSVSLTMSSADAVKMRFRNGYGAWSEWEDYAESRAWTLDSGDGLKTVYVDFMDVAGNTVDESIYAYITLITVPPTINSVTSPVIINFKPITVTYSVAESICGIEKVTLWVKRKVDGVWTSTGLTSSQASGFFNYSPDTDGTYYFDLVVEDVVGNISEIPVGSGRTGTVLDMTPPTGSILINDGSIYANNEWVTLTLSSSDASQMRFKNESGSWSSWENYATTKAWTLSAGDGFKTVYAQFRDAAGNVSSTTIKDVILDTTPPTGTITINDGAVYTTSASVALVLASADAVQMRFKNESGSWSAWQAYATGKSWVLSPGDGMKTVYVQFRDVAGNASSSRISDIILDTTPPGVSIGYPSVPSTTGDSVTYHILFSGANKVTLSAADIILNKTGTANAASVVVSGTGLSSRLVTISDITGNGSLGISILPGTATDEAGNVALADGPSAAFDVIDRIHSYGLSNKAAWDPVIALASSATMFTVWGKVTGQIDANSFFVDDGSGMPVRVNYAGHGLTAADYVSATGAIDVSGASPIMNALVINKLN